MAIIISSDYSDAYGELDRLIGMPTPKMSAGLDAVFEAGFAGVQERVHVQTGALLASGKKGTKTSVSSWQGDFSFDAGHAIFEVEREEQHDFMSHIFLLNLALRTALLKGLAK